MSKEKNEEFTLEKIGIEEPNGEEYYTIQFINIPRDIWMLDKTKSILNYVYNKGYEYIDQINTNTPASQLVFRKIKQ